MNQRGLLWIENRESGVVSGGPLLKDCIFEVLVFQLCTKACTLLHLVRKYFYTLHDKYIMSLSNYKILLNKK